MRLVAVKKAQCALVCLQNSIFIIFVLEVNLAKKSFKLHLCITMFNTVKLLSNANAMFIEVGNFSELLNLLTN